MRSRALIGILISLLVTLSANAVAQGRELRISGAGASFPFPLYSAWFRHYNRITLGVRISYQSVGSGAGVRNLINRTVDFGAGDAAMTDGDGRGERRRGRAPDDRRGDPAGLQSARG